jgi:uncharacterized RDD family membrane protein YckC
MPPPGDAAPPRSVASKAPFQPALFPARDLPQVLPMESYAPEARRSRPRGSAGERRIATGRTMAARRQMDLYAIPVESRVVRYTNSPVASRSHRMLAAGLDFAMVLMAVGFFLILLQLLPGEVRLTRQTMAAYGVVTLTVLVFYKLLWCLAGADPPGMRWTNLRLLNFDGRPPVRRERMIRLAGACLGVAALGLGILWPLVDEETLAWHDHMSKTFATPVSR